MKKSTYVIISLSFCVGALLILSGFLLVKYKSTDNNIMQADRYFYLTHEPNKPLEANINKGIGEIPSVTIPYRHNVVRKYWAPLVSSEFSKNQPIRSTIVKRFSPRGLSYSNNIQSVEPVKYQSIRSGIVKTFTARWPSGYSKNNPWDGIDFVSYKKSQFYLARY